MADAAERGRWRRGLAADPGGPRLDLDLDLSARPLAMFAGELLDAAPLAAACA